MKTPLVSTAEAHNLRILRVRRVLRIRQFFFGITFSVGLGIPWILLRISAGLESSSASTAQEEDDRQNQGHVSGAVVALHSNF